MPPRPIHANHAGTSWPKAPGVEAAVGHVLSQPPQVGLDAFASAHAESCQWLGIDDPERLLLTPGCTSALAVVIGDLPWQPGDVVLTSRLEHHALIRPIEQLVRGRGVVHETAPRATGAPVDLDVVRHILEVGNVRLVAATAASNVTGELLPMAELSALAHEHGALFLVDAAQSLGVLPLDVRTLGADLLVFTGHKAVMATHGIGGLWAAPGVGFESPDAVCEIASADDGPANCAAFPGYCDVGSVNLAAAAGLGAAVAWHRAQGSAPGDHARALCAKLRGALRARTDCRVLGAETAEHTGALSVKIDGLALADAEHLFADRGITVRAAQHCAPQALRALGEHAGTLRISLGAFNTYDDVDAILDTIETRAR